MSTLTDSLLQAQDTLLADAREIPARDLRAFTSLVIEAIGVLEARARGSRIIYANGVPSAALALEGDLGVNRANGDLYEFKGGQFVFFLNTRCCAEAPPEATVYTATRTYTTTAEDFVVKCGAGTSGAQQSATATATSTQDQDAADKAALAQAKADARAKIVCPVPLPVYNTKLDRTTVIADGMSFTVPENGLEELHFNLIANTSGASIDIAITVAGRTSYTTLAGEYAGKGYWYRDQAGNRHDGVFPSSDNLTISY